MEKYVVILTGSQKGLVERALTDTVTGPNRREGIAAQPLLHGLLNLTPASESALLSATVSDDVDAHQPLPFFVTVSLSTKQTLRFRTADDAIEMFETLVNNGYAAEMDGNYYFTATHYSAPTGIEG